MDVFYGIVEFFVSGGAFMYPILLVFAVGTAIALERFVTLSRITSRNDSASKAIQPLLSNGEFPAARSYHKRNVAQLAGYARAGLPIVGTSTSCTLTLQEEAPELLDMTDEGTIVLKLATYDIFEWLRELHDAGELATD